MTAAAKKARIDYVAANEATFLESNPIPDFDPDWYPAHWLVFVYLGGASDLNNPGNPFKPRSAKSMVEEESRGLKDIADHVGKCNKNKKIRRGIREDFPADMTGSAMSATAPMVQTIVISHTVIKSAVATQDAAIKRAQLKVDTLNALKEKGHEISGKEIVDAEKQLLTLIRGEEEPQNKGKATNESIVTEAYEENIEDKILSLSHTVPGTDKDKRKRNEESIDDEIISLASSVSGNAIYFADGWDKAE